MKKKKNHLKKKIKKEQLSLILSEDLCGCGHKRLFLRHLRNHKQEIFFLDFRPRETDYLCDSFFCGIKDGLALEKRAEVQTRMEPKSDSWFILLLGVVICIRLFKRRPWLGFHVKAWVSSCLWSSSLKNYFPLTFCSIFGTRRVASAPLLGHNSLT